MNRNRIRSVIALLLVMLLVFLTGCTGKTAETKAPLPTPRDGYQWITDCAGRKVEIPKEPQRVAALDSFAGEAMVMIGAGEKMVAAPNGVKSDSLLKLIYPGLEDVGVPLSGGTISAESLLSLQPDLIFLKGAMYTEGGEGEKLKKLGIPYLVVGLHQYGTTAGCAPIDRGLSGRKRERARHGNE